MTDSLRMPKWAVEVTDLTVAYDAKPVLWDVDLKIPSGKLTAVIGPNGAGKTTLLKAMLGLLKPVTGSVHFHFDEPDRDKTANEIAQNMDQSIPFHPHAKDQISLKNLRGSIGYVPQSGSVDWDFPATARDVVLMGRYGKLGWIRRPKAHDKEIADEMLAKVGMLDYATRQISHLSGGQQQRVFLARALAQDARLYFMDEPFKGVDVNTEHAIVELLKELRERGVTVVVVHHDLKTVPDYFDWATLINLRLVANGPVDEVFLEDNLRKTYTGTSAAVGEVV